MNRCKTFQITTSPVLVPTPLTEEACLNVIIHLPLVIINNRDNHKKKTDVGQYQITKQGKNYQIISDRAKFLRYSIVFPLIIISNNDTTSRWFSDIIRFKGLTDCLIRPLPEAQLLPYVA